MSTAWARVPKSEFGDFNYRIDPYLVWAGQSDWQGFVFDPCDSKLPVMIDYAGPFDRIPPWLADLRKTNRLNFLSSRYWTFVIERSQLVELTRAVETKCLERFQLGLARGPHYVQQGSGTINLSSLWSSLTHFATVGIVDDGCCFAHGAYRTASKRTHFVGVWDQNATSSPDARWKRFLGVDYGEELDSGAIEQLLQKHPALGEFAERAVYQLANRPRWGEPGRTHGAGVLHTATGTSRRRWSGPATPPDSSTNPPQMPIPLIFVQLPSQTVYDTSGGSLGVYLLDAVRYVVFRTFDSKPKDATWSTTVNVSLGSIAGPHDGSSITECALAELSRHSKHVEIVIAAGNIARQRLHAVRKVSAKFRGRFTVLIPPDNQRETYVELWLPELVGKAPVDPGWFRIEVEAPGAGKSSTVKVGEARVLGRRPRSIACVVFPRRVAQGLSGTMILIAVCGTIAQPGRCARIAPYGFWKITIRSTNPLSVPVHAWLERNDSVIGVRQPQMARFVDDGSRYVNDDSTLSSIASGEGVSIVGGYVQSRSSVAHYSANGPGLNDSDRWGPDVYAPCDESDVLRGLPVPGFFTGQASRMAGTSVAAPTVTHWLASGSPCERKRKVAPAPAGDGQDTALLPPLPAITW